MQWHAEDLDLNGQLARYHVLPGGPVAAHFTHANGYPPGVYAPLLERLGGALTIEALQLRAMWPQVGSPPSGLRWAGYGDDLVTFLERRGRGPVLGLGHSMGAAATLHAAARRPELFSALVVMEPAAVPAPMAFLDRVLPMFPRRWFMQPAKSTFKRRERWESRAAFREQIAGWRSLGKLSAEALDAFAEHCVREEPDGSVVLTFPREWEGHNFLRPAAIWRDLRRVRCPITVLRGDASMFFSEKMWASWRQMRPDDVFHQLPGHGHLLPMEAPEWCAERILQVCGA